MKFNLLTLYFFTATTLLSVSCSSNPVVMRNPASVLEIKGRSIPENSIIESQEASFAIKEQGVRISESVSTTLEKPAGKYMLEVEGVLSEDFRSLQGTFSVSFKDGDDAITHKRHVGTPKYGHIKISRNWTGKSAFFEWYQASQKDRMVKFDRATVSVVIYNENYEPVRINFFEAWPTKWKGPQLNATFNADLTEEIEISFKSYEMK